MGRQAAVSEDPGVHLRVQGLDTSVEALREPRNLTNLSHRHPMRGQLFSG